MNFARSRAHLAARRIGMAGAKGVTTWEGHACGFYYAQSRAPLLACAAIARVRDEASSTPFKNNDTGLCPPAEINDWR